MKCNICGYEFTEGKKYCPLCGARAMPAVQVPAASSASQEAAPAMTPEASASGAGTASSAMDEMLRSLESKYSGISHPTEEESRTADEEAARKEAEEEAARKAAEEEARKIAEEETRKEAEEQALKTVEADTRSSAEEPEPQAIDPAAEEAARKAAEEEARIAAQQAAQKAEEDRLRRKEEEARLAKSVSHVDNFFKQREAEKQGQSAVQPASFQWKAEEKPVKKDEPLNWGEFESGKASGAQSTEAVNWISLDFPKPREVKDITMAWDKPLLSKEEEMAQAKAQPNPVWPENIMRSGAKATLVYTPLQGERPVGHTEFDWNQAPAAEPAAQPAPQPEVQQPAEELTKPEPAPLQPEEKELPEGAFRMPRWNDLTYTRPSFTEEERAKIKAADSEPSEISAAPVTSDTISWEDSIKAAAAKSAALAKQKEEERAAEAARIQAEQEALRRAAEEEARKAAEEEMLRKAAADAAALKAAEEALKQVKDAAPQEEPLSENPQEEVSPEEAPADRPESNVGFTSHGFIDPAEVEPRKLRSTPFVQPLENRASAEFNWNQTAEEPVRTFSAEEEAKPAQPQPAEEETAPAQPQPAEEPAAPLSQAGEDPLQQQPQTEETAPAAADVAADDAWLQSMSGDKTEKKQGGIFDSFIIANTDAPEDVEEIPPADLHAEPKAPLLTEAAPEKASPKPATGSHAPFGAAQFQKLLDLEANRIRKTQDEEPVFADSNTRVFSRIEFQTAAAAPAEETEDKAEEDLLTPEIPATEALPVEQVDADEQLALELSPQEQQPQSPASQIPSFEPHTEPASAPNTSEETSQAKPGGEQAPSIRFVDVTSAIGEEAFRHNTVELRMAEMKKKEAEEELHRSEYRKKLEQMAKAREAFFRDDDDEDEQPRRRFGLGKAKDAAEAGEENELKKQQSEEAEDDEEEKLSRPGEAAEGSDDEDDDDDEEESGGHPLLLALLVLALLIGLAKGGVVAMKHFMPESSVTEIAVSVDEMATEAAKTGFIAIKKGADSLLHKIKKDETEQEEPDEAYVDPDIDLTALAAEFDPEGQLKALVIDPSLEYVEQRTSSYSDLAESQPCDDPQLRTAIYGVMTAYNSSWNKYVNDPQTDDVLSYLTADGEAYSKVLRYDNSDSTRKQEFRKLSLGQVRTFEGGAYVFTEEEISISSGSASSDFDDLMVYRLEAIGDIYKIVSYSEYK
ncbi:MAG: hypothetical protein HUJ80_06335 [Firmicutes bacterium]|nr:hypothetical protein [Bacillota bacterium]